MTDKIRGKTSLSKDDKHRMQLYQKVGVPVDQRYDTPEFRQLITEARSGGDKRSDRDILLRLIRLRKSGKLRWVGQSGAYAAAAEQSDDISLRICQDAAQIREPFFRWLSHKFLGRMHQPLFQLVDPSRSLETVMECTDALIECIKKIDAGSSTEIRAVCGQKAWNSQHVRAYYRENYAKAKQGTRVKRIFLQEPDKQFTDGEKRVLHEHLSGKNKNVEGKVVFEEDLHFLNIYNLPRGFGFAVLGDTVIVHWGLDEITREAGRRLDHPDIIKEHELIHRYLWEYVAKGETDDDKRRIWCEILAPGAHKKKQREMWKEIFGDTLPMPKI